MLPTQGFAVCGGAGSARSGAVTHVLFLRHGMVEGHDQIAGVAGQHVLHGG